jgi:hypothetical protein
MMHKHHRPQQDKKAKGKHKPDWQQMFADKINEHETRISALEQSQTNPIPQPPLAAEEAK